MADTTTNTKAYIALIGGIFMGLVLGAAFSRGCYSTDRYLLRQSVRFVSRITRDFYYPPDGGLGEYYSNNVDAFLRDIDSNSHNVGAEMLFFMLGNMWKSSDTDSDGRLEVVDAFGDPIVFLTDMIPDDEIINAHGYVTSVTRPPYCTGKYYLSVLSCHEWLADDSEVLREAAAVVLERRAEMGGEEQLGPGGNAGDPNGED